MRGQVSTVGDVGQVRLGQIGRATHQHRQPRGDHVDGLLGRLAGGLLLRLGERLLQPGVPAGGQLTGQRGPQLCGQLRLGLGVGVQPLLPRLPGPLALADPDAPALVHPLRHLEVLVRVPAVDLLGGPDLVLAQGGTVRLGGVLGIGCSPGDVGAQPDEAGSLGLLDRGLVGGGDRLQVVGVLHLLDVPAVGLVPPGHVLGEGDRSRPVDGDPVVVVQHRQLSEPQVTGQRRRLAGHALHHVAVATEHPGAMVDQLVSGPVVAGGQQPLGDRQPDPVANPLAQRAGGHLHSGGVPVLRVARRLGTQHALLLEVPDAQGIAGQVQHRILQHRGVPVGQHEPVPVEPLRVGRIEPQEPGPQHIGGRGQRHRRPRMAAARLLDGVHRQDPDGIDRQPVQVAAFGCLHGYTSTSWPSSDQRVWKVPGRSVRR